MHFNTLISQLKNRREELQVTQESLAEISRVGLRTIKQFERGKGNPTLRTITKLAEALGLEVNFQLKTTKLTE